MENSKTKLAKDYITFNLRGFFNHYKIEQNINKITIDIFNIQDLREEVNYLFSQVNKYQILAAKFINHKKLTNKKHKAVTKSTDAIKTRNTSKDKPQKNSINNLRNDLDKSNFSKRPKTPDVSKIFNKYKRKKNNTNLVNTKSNNTNKLSNVGSQKKSSFIKTKNYNLDHSKEKINQVKSKNNILKNKSQDKLSSFNIKNKNYNKEFSNSQKMSYFSSDVQNKTTSKIKQKTKKLNYMNNKERVSLDRIRVHSYDYLNKPKNKTPNKKMNDSLKKNKINKKTTCSRNIIPKTPSPLKNNRLSFNNRETITKNKNKKIVEVNNYKYNNFSRSKNKASNTSVKNKNSLRVKKDLTKEEEKKLEEQIMKVKNIEGFPLENNSINDKDSSKDLMNISQDILNNDLQNKNYNLFFNKYIESLYLSIKRGFFLPNEKLKILLLSKEIYLKFNIKDILTDYINYYESEIKKIKYNFDNYDINLINKTFTPKKTGLNSLKFITKNEEERLINEPQHDYVIKLFSIILILLNEYENYLKSNEQNIFKYLFEQVYNKFNVDNIKSLFEINFVEKIPIINKKQYDQVNKIIQEVPNLLLPTTLLKYNRSVSYLTFFLGELYNYFSIKAEDGNYYYHIRYMFFQRNKYLDKINIIKNYLN